jgi:integrase
LGLYKICDHKARERDRCEHAWWGTFRGIRVSLPKWTNREIRTKAEAGAALDELRTAIRSGTFDPRGQRPADTVPLTFAELADVYKRRHVLANRLSMTRSVDWRLKPLLQWFGTRRVADIRVSDVEDFIADLKTRRVRGGSGRLLSAASINRSIELLRHMLNWAVDREFVNRTPFRHGGVRPIKKLREDNRRRRRVSEAEEARLLVVAPPFLRSMIVAALDTGMRRGEMLALRFADVDTVRGLLTLRGETTKSGRTRVVPISTQRLRQVLEWLRIDIEGEKKSDETLVFSDEIGEPVGSFRTAWVNTVLRAHEIELRWDRSAKFRQLTSECMDAFRRIDLHWHDLRHEYASRLVEQGVPLAQVRDLLGHASIVTTERYDNQTVQALQLAAAKLERGVGFDTSASSTETFQESVNRGSVHAPGEDGREGSKTFSELRLGEWLGGRDSNPDNVVQSHVSYR